jgi:hypothetical protein
MPPSRAGTRREGAPQQRRCRMLASHLSPFTISVSNAFGPQKPQRKPHCREMRHIQDSLTLRQSWLARHSRQKTPAVAMPTHTKPYAYSKYASRLVFKPPPQCCGHHCSVGPRSCQAPWQRFRRTILSDGRLPPCDPDAFEAVLGAFVQDLAGGRGVSSQGNDAGLLIRGTCGGTVFAPYESSAENRRARSVLPSAGLRHGLNDQGFGPRSLL